MVLTSRVGGIGLNIHGASRTIIFEPDWNPGQDEQVSNPAMLDNYSLVLGGSANPPTPTNRQCGDLPADHFRERRRVDLPTTSLQTQRRSGRGEKYARIVYSNAFQDLV